MRSKRRADVRNVAGNPPKGDWNSQIESEVRHFSVFKMFKFPVNRVHLGSKFMISTNDLRRHLLAGSTCVRPNKNKSDCKLSAVS